MQYILYIYLLIYKSEPFIIIKENDIPPYTAAVREVQKVNIYYTRILFNIA